MPTVSAPLWTLLLGPTYPVGNCPVFRERGCAHGSCSSVLPRGPHPAPPAPLAPRAFGRRRRRRVADTDLHSRAGGRRLRVLRDGRRRRRERGRRLAVRTPTTSLFPPSTAWFPWTSLRSRRPPGRRALFRGRSQLPPTSFLPTRTGPRTPPLTRRFPTRHRPPPLGRRHRTRHSPPRRSLTLRSLRRQSPRRQPGPWWTLRFRFPVLFRRWWTLRYRFPASVRRSATPRPRLRIRAAPLPGDPAAPVRPAAPLPGDPAAVPPGGVVPGGIVSRRRRRGGIAGGRRRPPSMAQSAPAGAAKATAAKAAPAQPPAPAPTGTVAARPFPASPSPGATVAYPALLIPEPRGAAAVQSGAAPPAQGPCRDR